MKTKDNELDYWRNEEGIKCPHCDFLDEDAWEYELKFDGDSLVTNCPDCCELFKFTMHIDVSYSSDFTERKEDV